MRPQRILDADNIWIRERRPNQTPPPGDWRTWLILAGRGFGKTRTGAEWLFDQLMNQGKRRGLLAGATWADCQQVMVEGESGLLAVARRHGVEPTQYNSSAGRIWWPNGAYVEWKSAEKPKRFRGPQYDCAWADEIAAWERPDAWDMMQFGLRLGENPQVVATTTPAAVPLVKALLEQSMRGTVVVTRGTTMDNAENLAPEFLEEIINTYKDTRLYRQEILGEYLDDTPGALWKQATIDKTRVPVVPPFMVRVVIGVDPQGADPEAEEGAENRYASKSGSETGIVVVGQDKLGQGYVLEDASLSGTPLQWAKAVEAMYLKHRANKIIAEKNMGGAMVGAVMKQVDPNLPIELVTATRGKLVRAEPIAMLWEQGRIHMVGMHPKLEDQLTSYAGTGDSPDRLDALVWACTELYVEKASEVKSGSYLRRAKGRDDDAGPYAVRG